MLLKELTAARGVSGNEGEIRELLKKLSIERGASCTVDRMGNLLAQTDGGDAKAPHLLLAAHMDEVGMMVTRAKEDGSLCYRTVGGIDPRVMVSKKVSCGDNKIPGIIGAKAIHLQTREEMERVLSHESLYIDVGAKTKQEAEKLCPPGTYVTFDSPLTPFGDGCVCGKALDDRVGCLTLLKALTAGYPGKLTCAFTVQEEVGLRGATVVGHWAPYDLAVVLEGTAANDLGQTPVQSQVCNLGKGVALSHIDRASIVHPRLHAVISEVALLKNIPCQPKRFVSGGNDAGALQTGAGAKPTAVLSVPCRYIHSPLSVASLSDIEAQATLVCAFMESLPEKWAEISANELEEVKK